MSNKKPLAVLLASLLATSIVGCNSGQGGGTTPNTQKTNNTVEKSSSSESLSSPVVKSGMNTLFYIKNNTNETIKINVPDSDHLDCQVGYLANTDKHWYNCGGHDAAQNGEKDLDGLTIAPGQKIPLSMHTTGVGSPSLSVLLNGRPGFDISNTEDAYDNAYNVGPGLKHSVLGVQFSPARKGVGYYTVWLSYNKEMSLRDIIINDGSVSPYENINQDTLHAGEMISDVAYNKDNKLTSLVSKNGYFKLMLDYDSDHNKTAGLYLYNQNGEELWRAAAYTNAPKVTLDHNGNLKYDASLIKSSQQDNSSLTLQDDGNLVFYDASHNPVWSTGMHIYTRGINAVPSNKLCANPTPDCPNTLKRPIDSKTNNIIVSDNGLYYASMQNDGNFVIYNNSGQPTWATNTKGSAGAYLVIGSDGNLVLSRYLGNETVWKTNTENQGATYLALGDDGNLGLYRQDGSTVWAINTIWR